VKKSTAYNSQNILHGDILYNIFKERNTKRFFVQNWHSLVIAIFKENGQR